MAGVGNVVVKPVGEVLVGGAKRVWDNTIGKLIEQSADKEIKQGVTKLVTTTEAKKATEKTLTEAVEKNTVETVEKGMVEATEKSVGETVEKGMVEATEKSVGETVEKGMVEATEKGVGETVGSKTTLRDRWNMAKDYVHELQVNRQFDKAERYARKRELRDAKNIALEEQAKYKMAEAQGAAIKNSIKEASAKSSVTTASKEAVSKEAASKTVASEGVDRALTERSMRKIAPSEFGRSKIKGVATVGAVGLGSVGVGAALAGGFTALTPEEQSQQYALAYEQWVHGKASDVENEQWPEVYAKLVSEGTASLSEEDAAEFARLQSLVLSGNALSMSEDDLAKFQKLNEEVEVAGRAALSEDELAIYDKLDDAAAIENGKNHVAAENSARYQELVDKSNQTFLERAAGGVVGLGKDAVGGFFGSIKEMLGNFISGKGGMMAIGGLVALVVGVVSDSKLLKVIGAAVGVTGVLEGITDGAVSKGVGDLFKNVTGYDSPNSAASALSVSYVPGGDMYLDGGSFVEGASQGEADGVLYEVEDEQPDKEDDGYHQEVF